MFPLRAPPPLPLVVAALLGLTLGACKGSLGAVKVNVTLAGDATTQCVVAWARSGAGSRLFSDKVPRTDSDFVFAIQETAELVGALTVGIDLYATPDCSGTPYYTATQETTLERGRTTTLNFDVRFGDGDGGVDGGLDDGGTGDAGTCVPSLCTTPPPCRTTPGTCGPTGCEYPVAPEGTDCGDAGACNAVGTCGTNRCPFTTPGDFCNDGLDCTLSDLCLSMTDCRGSCPSPPSSECNQRVLGVCATDGGCAYTPVNPNGVCGAGGRCTADGTCLPWFPQAPSNLPDDVRALVYPTAGWTASKGADAGPCVIDTSGAAPGPRDPAANCGFVGQGQRFTQADGGELAVFAATSLLVPGDVELRFVGARPAVLAIFGDATIQGVVSVAAAQGAEAPAGAGAEACPAPGAAVAEEGGAGGSYRTRGGAGGNDVLAPGLDNGNNGGVPLRGGCQGAAGGGPTPGDGGVGGGALQLSVVGQLVVIDGGVLSASGAGGLGGTLDTSGGGGGGSGGTLLLEAQRIVLLNCALTANGGGGGQGGKNGQATGENGSDGSRTTSSPASGGNIGSIGGNGGAGGNLANNGSPGENGGGAEGGGGGGGGVGLVRLRAQAGCSANGLLLSGERSGQGTGCN